jgi:dTDP-4-dehydrorhamnose reductase
MRVVVIGTSGQLATELHRGARSAAVELLPPEKIDVSIASEVDALLDRTRPALVLNAAAYTAVDRAEAESERAFAVNETGPTLLARWCQANGSALIHVSSDYVFDGTKRGAYSEDDQAKPLGVYGESKLAGEKALRATLERHLTLRTSWVFSAHSQNFVKTMLRLAQERDELRVVADQIGRPTAAAALARTLLALAERLAAGAPLAWGTYHFANAGSVTWHGFAEAIVDEQECFTQRRPRVTPILTSEYPTPAKRPANSVLDTSRFEQTFGITPSPWRDELHCVVREIFAPRSIQT